MPKRRVVKPTVEASPLAGMLYFPTALMVEQMGRGSPATGLPLCDQWRQRMDI